MTETVLKFETYLRCETLYTIGYSGFDIQTFTDAMNAYSINVIVDVRRKPYSSRFPDSDINMQFRLK